MLPLPRQSRGERSPGTATAADIEQLVAHIQSTVLARQGVRLTPEFRIGGDSATGKVPDELRFSVQEAADACPVAINHVEDG